MPIGLYERFTAYDWVKYSNISGRIVTLLCLILSLISFISNYNILISLWTLFVGLFISIWELSNIWIFISNFNQIQEFCLEKLKYKHSGIRSITYICLSIVCFLDETPCILAGLGLILSGILYIFAQINQNEDAKDGTDRLFASQQRNPRMNDNTNLINESRHSTFGTFF